MTAHTIEEYVLRAFHIASLMHLDASSLVRKRVIQQQQASNLTSFVVFHQLIDDLLFPNFEERDVDVIKSNEQFQENAHQTLRRLLCSKKSNLFSNVVLEKVTVEWRDLFVHLAKLSK